MEDPRLQRRPLLERAETLDHAGPDILDDLLGAGLGAHEDAGQANERAVMAIDELRERLRLPRAQPADDVRVVVCRRASTGGVGSGVQSHRLGVVSADLGARPQGGYSKRLAPIVLRIRTCNVSVDPETGPWTTVTAIRVR